MAADEALRPMLAVLADASLRDPRLVYERKYDGIRAIVEVDAEAEGRSGGGARVRIASRAGNDKTSQFPEIVASLAPWIAARGGSVVLDGEIVALDRAGAALGFQRIQERIHLTGGESVKRLATERPTAYVVFDVILADGKDLRALPLVERRMKLEQIFAASLPAALRLSEIAVGDGTALHERALAEGWEGLLAKVGASRYRSGERSADWRKLKLVKRQEFVIAGWTEPRRSRAGLGALLLGQHDAGGLRYAGHVGSGFSEKDLDKISKLLGTREIADCPFGARPPTNERPHWVRSELVAEVQFSGWSDDGIARHAVFVGLRDDVAPATVVREEAVSNASVPPPAARAKPPTGAQLAKLTAALDDLEASATGGGVLELPGGVHLEVTNLGKVLWPSLSITKGDLMRYEVAVAPYLLPVVADRPLVMRRFPNGVARSAFYQQRAPDEAPRGVRVERVAADKEVPTRVVGGSLATLLYTAQLAAISQDPWLSRVGSIDELDFAVIDLDPLEGTPFSRVLEVARWVHDELVALGVEAFVKTSGATGLHVYLPMPPETPYETGLLFCQIVATQIAGQHPRVATVERTVQKRPAGSVYIDYLQNIRGKTLACAYSARASAFAGASTPLRWTEIGDRPDPRDFTIRTLPSRIAGAGDLWAKLRRAPGIDLGAALDRARTRYGPARPR